MTEPAKIGRYDILQRVGRGGMGVLYRGRDSVLEREVAIKVMAGDFASDEEARARFYREARAAARLQHRNIVTIFEFGEEDGTPFMVMEFLHGSDLATRLRAGPPLSLDRKLDIVVQLCTGLHFAHQQGVIHRDIKPANIWLLQDSTVKLLDFGIAKMATSTLTQQAGVIGTASYMSPEQVSGKTVDGRSDLFSVGVVLYELVAGRKPFEADSPTGVLMKIMQEEPEPIDKLVPGLPPGLTAAVSRALQKKLEDRYARAGDLAADLQVVRVSLQPDADTMLEDVRLGGDTPGSDAAAGVRLRRSGTVSVAEPAGQAVIARTELAARTFRARLASYRWLVTPVIGLLVIVGLVASVMLGGKRTPPTEGTGKNQAIHNQAQAGGGAGGPSGTTGGKGGAMNTGAGGTAVVPSVVVTSEPPGASIMLDGRDTGLVTPAQLKIEWPLKPLRVTKRGFQPLDLQLSEGDLKQGRVDLRLVPVVEVPQTTVTITGSYPFQVLEGSRVVSEAAESHEVTVVGRRALRLRAPQYFLDREVTVDPGGKRRMSLGAPELGSLTIRTSLETCSVSIGDRPLGFPPIIRQPIAAGSYLVALSCPDGDQRRVNVTIAAGQQRVEIIR